MAKWYDPYLTDQEKKRLQVGQKGIRARQRKQAIEQNVPNAAAGVVTGATSSVQRIKNAIQDQKKKNKVR